MVGHGLYYLFGSLRNNHIVCEFTYPNSSLYTASMVKIYIYCSELLYFWAYCKISNIFLLTRVVHSLHTIMSWLLLRKWRFSMLISYFVCVYFQLTTDQQTQENSRSSITLDQNGYKSTSVPFNKHHHGIPNQDIFILWIKKLEWLILITSCSSTVDIISMASICKWHVSMNIYVELYSIYLTSHWLGLDS